MSPFREAGVTVGLTVHTLSHKLSKCTKIYRRERHISKNIPTAKLPKPRSGKVSPTQTCLYTSHYKSPDLVLPTFRGGGGGV